ncbi:hypothetical protein ACLMJK_001415 [Lecanora helva]
MAVNKPDTDICQSPPAYTTVIHTASTLLSSPIVLTDLTALINANYQDFYTPFIPDASKYFRLPNHSSLPEELGPSGFMIVKYDGQVPVASSGAKLWDPGVKVASNTRLENEYEIGPRPGDGSEWERIMTSVRQEDKYKGKGLAKEMVRRVEAECARRFKEENRRCDVDGQTESGSKVRCITRCTKGLVSGFHEKLGYKVVAEELVPGMEQSEIRILTMERFLW